jgi:hypothetical protein
MTVCLRGRVKVLGEGVRASSSSTSARGNGEGSKNGVAGATGMFLINSPANIRDGMRADVPLDGLLKLRKMTNFHLTRPTTIKSALITRKWYEPLKKTRTV